MIGSKLEFSLHNLRERLWIKPLGYALLAVLAVFLAHLADLLPLRDIVPEISDGTIEKLLTVISASMLGVATFAVASMVASYASASRSATPRALVLVIADGQSQTALSSFIGAFIFSIVGIIAIRVGYFGVAGRFAIFLVTLAVFAWVIVTFVRWVDNIARLGRIGNTIEKVEDATREAFGHWRPSAPLEAIPCDGSPGPGVDLHSSELGFIQHVDVEALNDWAKRNEARVHLRSHPGALITPRRPLLTVTDHAGTTVLDMRDLRDAFVLGPRRSFALDPRFGLIALSEIGSRALSPAVNDPGTAVEIVIRLAHILRDWSEKAAGEENSAPRFDRVYVPPLDPRDLLEDSCAAIIRDGVTSIEVGIWIQKMLGFLSAEAGPELGDAARWQAMLALERAGQELTFTHDIERVKRAHALAFRDGDLS